jgi:hypothetical protein
MQLIVFISIGFLCVALESDITLKAMGSNPVKIFFYFSKFSFFHSLFLEPDSVNSKVIFLQKENILKIWPIVKTF